MIKVYFAQNWGLTSRQMCENYIKQTPGCLGAWENIQVTYDIDDADYLIIEDNCSLEDAKRFNNKTRIYFSREALDSSSHVKYGSRHFIRSTFWDNTGYLYTKWVYNGSAGGIMMSYDDLNKETPVTKSKTISTVQSNKQYTKVHRDRVNFINKMVDKTNLDVYGSINCANNVLINNDKKSALDDYKYCLAFDNQVTIKDFFGTQFTDSILRWTVPIYGGGADLEKYFPSKSFIKVDPTDMNEVDRVIDLLEKDDYNERLEALTEARRLILDTYNIWPTIKKIIDDQEGS